MAQDGKTEEELQRRIATLEARVVRLMARIEALEAGAGDVLRVRGLVVEDSDGRARILLGAPVPRGSGRKRTDPATAMVLLDGQGNDRVAVGFVPDQQVQGQIEPNGTPRAGIVVCDSDGNERGGFGIMDANGSAGLGIDYPGGREGVSAFVSGDGLAGISVQDKQLAERIVIAFQGDQGRYIVKLPPAAE